MNSIPEAHELPFDVDALAGGVVFDRSDGVDKFERHFRKKTMPSKTAAPELKRIYVKLAGSIKVCAKARRQRTELPANAISASAVNASVRLESLLFISVYPKEKAWAY